MPKIRLKVNEDVVKTYSSEISLTSSIYFHLLNIHPYQIFETVNGRFTAVFNPRTTKHYIREKGFLTRDDVFK